MRELTNFERAILHLLADGCERKSTEIASELNSNNKKITYHISRIRKKFSERKENAIYIHLGKSGYTTKESVENLRNEGIVRLKMGTSIIINGAHVYSRYKAISLDGHHSLRIAFKPKALHTIDVLSQTVDGRRRINATPLLIEKR
jgi:hypothetical protein